MVVDLHSDLLLAVDHARVRGRHSALADHLPALRAAGVRVQVLAVFVPSAFVPESALRLALRLIDAAWREAEESNDALRIVGTRAELDAALADGAVAGILALEGAEPLGREPRLVRVLHRLGMRMLSPTWNRANAFAEGAAEDTGAGLTTLGRRLLDEMAAVDMVLDVSHLAPTAAREALDVYPGPVVASHSNAAAVYANARNADDDLLGRLAARGGVCGVNAQRAFLGPGDPAERAADHVAHLAGIAPSLPAFGADFTGFLPPGPAEPRGLGLPPGTDLGLATQPEPPRETFYDQVGEALRRRSVPEADIAALHGGNALRVLRDALR